MVTPQELVSQELANAWTAAAQRYAGYFYGHPTTAEQQRAPVHVDYERTWDEPLVFADNCAFCQATTDSRVEERIRGYQAAIDIEVVRSKSHHWVYWLTTRGKDGSHETRRQFVQENEGRWKHLAIDLTKLPAHLKRRLCIEWNHLLRDWLAANPVFEYDLEAREIRVRPTPRDLDEPRAADPEEDQAIRDLEAEDHAYAVTPFGGAEQDYPDSEPPEGW